MSTYIRHLQRDPKTMRVIDWGSVRCPKCGCEHNLQRGDSDCLSGCGQEFNAAGQALAPRSQWEE